MNWTLFSNRLVNSHSAARKMAIENMRDGVIILDASDQIVELNPSIRGILNHDSIGSIDPSTEPILASCYQLLREFKESGHSQAEIFIGDGASQQFYEVQLTPLMNRSRGITGHMFVLHETTDRKRAEEEFNATLIKTEGLYTLSRALISLDNLPAMLHATVNVVAETLPADRVILAIFDLEKRKRCITCAPVFTPMTLACQRLTN